MIIYNPVAKGGFGMSVKKAIFIGVPAVLAVAAGIIALVRRRRSRAAY